MHHRPTASLESTAYQQRVTEGNPNVLSLAIKHSFQRVFSCLEMKQMKATCVNGCRKAIMSSTGNAAIEHWSLSPELNSSSGHPPVLLRGRWRKLPA